MCNKVGHGSLALNDVHNQFDHGDQETKEQKDGDEIKDQAIIVAERSHDPKRIKIRRDLSAATGQTG
jgi:hypothetical protein